MQTASLNLAYSNGLDPTFYFVPLGYDITASTGRLLIRKEGVLLYNRSDGISVVDIELEKDLQYRDGTVIPVGTTVKALQVAPDLSVVDPPLADTQNNVAKAYKYGLYIDEKWGLQGLFTVWPDTGAIRCHSVVTGTNCGPVQFAVNVCGVVEIGAGAAPLPAFSGPGFLARSDAGSGPIGEHTAAEAVGILPAATVSNDGIMTAAQATLLLGRYKGAGTTIERDALSSPQAGWQWYNTDWKRDETYSGTYWLANGQEEMENRTGSNTVKGYIIKISGINDNAFVLPGSDNSVHVWGIVETAGVPNGDLAVVTLLASGLNTKALVWNGSDVDSGDYIYANADGTGYTASGANTGMFGKTLESVLNASLPGLVTISTSPAEIY